MAIAERTRAEIRMERIRAFVARHPEFAARVGAEYMAHPLEEPYLTRDKTLVGYERGVDIEAAREGVTIPVDYAVWEPGAVTLGWMPIEDDDGY